MTYGNREMAVELSDAISKNRWLASRLALLEAVREVAVEVDKYRDSDGWFQMEEPEWDAFSIAREQLHTTLAACAAPETAPKEDQP